jgi:Ni/Co efflux regulator RcnB
MDIRVITCVATPQPSAQDLRDDGAARTQDSRAERHRDRRIEGEVCKQALHDTAERRSTKDTHRALYHRYKLGARVVAIPHGQHLAS